MVKVRRTGQVRHGKEGVIAQVDLLVAAKRNPYLVFSADIGLDARNAMAPKPMYILSLVGIVCMKTWGLELGIITQRRIRTYLEHAP